MKKRLLVLLLAFLMMLSVAAPALAEEEDEVVDVVAEAVAEAVAEVVAEAVAEAIAEAIAVDPLYLGQTFTAEEFAALLELGVLDAYHAQLNGARFEGDYLDWHGALYNEYKITPNVFVFHDEVNDLYYLTRVVWSNGGFLLQIIGVGYVNPIHLTPDEVLIIVGSTGHISMVSQEG